MFNGAISPQKAGRELWVIAREAQMYRQEARVPLEKAARGRKIKNELGVLVDEVDKHGNGTEAMVREVMHITGNQGRTVSPFQATEALNRFRYNPFGSPISGNPASEVLFDPAIRDLRI